MGQNIRIKEVEVFTTSSGYGNGSVLGQPLGVKSLSFVKITANTGEVGIGEVYCSIYTPELIKPIVDCIAQYIIGKDPTDPGKLAEEVQIPFVSRSGLFCNVYSAVDIALWDIKSQCEKLPLWQSLNIENQKSSLPVYISGGSAAYSPSQIKDEIIKMKEMGFGAFKMRVGFQDWQMDLRRIECARETLGPDGHLMVDAIMGSINPPWDETQAAQRSKDLLNFSLTWLEEPLHPDNLEGLKTLHDNCRIPIATGEALNGLLDYTSYINSGAVDVLQIDVTHCGGITLATKVADKALKAGLKIAMHVWGSKIAYAANAHFAFSHPAVEWLEIPNVPLEISSMMSLDSFNCVEGVATPLECIGIGVGFKGEIFDQFPFVSKSGFQLPKRV